MEQLLSIVRHRFANAQSDRYGSTFINGIWFASQCTPHLWRI